MEPDRFSAAIATRNAWRIAHEETSNQWLVVSKKLFASDKAKTPPRICGAVFFSYVVFLLKMSYPSIIRIGGMSLFRAGARDRIEWVFPCFKRRLSHAAHHESGIGAICYGVRVRVRDR